MSKDLWPESNRNPTSSLQRFFFVFLPDRSCAFVDRLLIVSEKNDPPNHTKKNHNETHEKVARNFKSFWLALWGEGPAVELFVEPAENSRFSGAERFDPAVH